MFYFTLDAKRRLEMSRNVFEFKSKEAQNVKITFPQVSLTQIVTNIFPKYPSVVC